MHVPISPRVLSHLAAGLLLVVAFNGCSPKAKLERHIANGQRYMAEGHYDAAEIEFLNAQRLDPRSGAAMAGLGSLFFDQGSLTKAAPRLLAARELAPDDLDARIRLARTFATLGRTDDARTEAQSVLERRSEDAEAVQLLVEIAHTPEERTAVREKLSGDSAPVQVGLALLELKENRPDIAAGHIERALSADPNYAAAYSIRAGVHLLRSELEPAESALRRAVELSPVRSPRRLALVRFLLGRGQAPAAQELLKETVKQAPDFVPAALLLAELALASGGYDEAQSLVETALNRDPENPEALILRARTHLARGENTAAVALLERATARYADLAPLHQLLGSAYLATGDANRAGASLARAVQLAPDHVDAVIMRSALQIRAGDPASAVLALRELLKKHPDSGRARMLLGEALRVRGQTDEALQVYRDAIQLAPQDPQLRFFAGVMLAQLGRAAEARENFEQTLNLRPDFTPAVEQLVALDLGANNAGAAAQRAQQYAAKQPTNADAHVLVAKVALAQNDATAAEAALRRAIEINAEAAGAYMMLAQLYLKGNRQDDAQANLQTAVAKNPRDITALMLLGILQQQKGDLQTARETYERLLQTNPRFVPALNNLAYLYSENFGELDKAYDLANRAREIRPNDPIAQDTFGWILFQRRDYAWAASVLAESASKLATHPEVNYHLGMARYMLGDEDGARRALAQAASATETFPGKDKAAAHLAILEIDPATASDSTIATLRARLTSTADDPVALARLAAILQIRGQNGEAQKLYESALQAHPQNATAMVNLARFLLAQPNGVARALELGRNAYKIAPEDPAVLHTLGRAAFLSGDHAWSASLLRDAARRNPSNGRVQVDFAYATYSVGSLDESLAAMKQALPSLGSTDDVRAASTFVQLVEATMQRPIPPSAQQLATATASQDPNYLAALMVLATAHEQNVRALEAIAVYETALSTYPRFTPALRRRAVLMAQASPTSPATLAAANKAREALPNDADVAAALGTVHFRRGEYPRAATLLGEAAKAQAAPAEVHGLLGLAQRQLGDKDRSRASLQRALDLGLAGPLADEVRGALSGL